MAIRSDMDNLSDIHCPGCRGLRHKSLGDLRVPVESQEPHPQVLREMVGQTIPSRLLKCEDCGLVFRENSLTEDQLRTLYSHLPEKNWDYEPTSVGSWKAATHELLKRYATRHDVRILDVGAYDGSFLSQLPDSWEKSAIEPSTSASEALRAKGIVRIASFLEDKDLEDKAGAFDCITVLDVFEHLRQPSIAVERLLALLKPEGMLFISTGNADHWTMRMLKGQHWYFHTAQHLCVGSETYFRRLASDLRLNRLIAVPHSHKQRPLTKAFDDTVETLYWKLRRSPAPLSWVSSAIHTTPRYRKLLHKHACGKCDAVCDHILLVFQKQPEG